MKKQHGLTLIELLVTITLVIIISMLGVPRLNNMMKANRLTGQINRLVTDLAYARTEAIKRTALVRLTPVNAGNWNNGWSVTLTANGQVLRNATGSQTPDATLSTTNGVAMVEYNADGRTATTVTFNLCDDRGGNTGKRVTLNTTGQTYLETQIACP